VLDGWSYTRLEQHIRGYSMRAEGAGIITWPTVLGKGVETIRTVFEKCIEEQCWRLLEVDED